MKKGGAERSPLLKIINAQGYAFQLKVEHEITRTNSSHGWVIEAEEHAWLDRNGEERFIDLILRHGATYAVIECKRRQDSDWVFLSREESDPFQREVRCRWTEGDSGRDPTSGVGMARMLPSTEEAAFCAVRGSGEGDRPMLERIAAELVRSVDALAEEELGLIGKTQSEWARVYVPVIVTTARLHAMRLDPASVSIADGQIPAGNTVEVQWIRFRKPLTVRTGPSRARSLRAANEEQERTVFIVRAGALVEWLDQFSVLPEEPPIYTYPWTPRTIFRRGK